MGVDVFGTAGYGDEAVSQNYDTDFQSGEAETAAKDIPKAAKDRPPTANPSTVAPEAVTDAPTAEPTNTPTALPTTTPTLTPI